MSQVGIIIGREFNERVRKKSFIITTLLMPLLSLNGRFNHQRPLRRNQCGYR